MGCTSSSEKDDRGHQSTGVAEPTNVAGPLTGKATVGVTGTVSSPHAAGGALTTTGGAKGNGGLSVPTAGSGPGSSGAATPNTSKRGVDLFLATVLPAFFTILSYAASTGAAASAATTQALDVMFRAFVSTTVNFAKQTFRISFEESRRTVGAALRQPPASASPSDCTTCKPQQAVIESAVAAAEEHAVDEGLFRLLEAWANTNPLHAQEIDRDAALALLRELDVWPAPSDVIDGTSPTSPSKAADPTVLRFPPPGAKIGFGGIARLYYQAVCSPGAVAIFEKLVGSKDPHACMDNATLQRVLAIHAVDPSTVTEQTTAALIRTHFGGLVSRRNFCSFFNSRKSNSVLEPRRVASVWQDMTQPLPSYLVFSSSVTSEQQTIRALHENTRAFMLSGLHFMQSVASPSVPQPQPQHHDPHHNTSVRKSHAASLRVMAGPDFTFKAFCEIIRDKGFKRSPYPILIVLPSQLRLTADQEEAVADQLNESLGHMIARGLMFAGGTARDPQFNPASLRHKVLIMGAQGTLRPFVGLFVADMARGGLGVRVTDVKDASPAAKAGLIKDDWITRINDRKIDDKTALKKQLSTFHLGDEFTITKENLTEARVVVGGAVDPTDAAHASALSELIYFNYNKPDRAARQAKHAREAAQAHADGAATPAPGDDFAPWETEVVSSAALASATKPQEHFMLVQPAPVPANATPADEARFEREMLAAEHVGAQLIDSNATMAARRWARGTFLVNGQCGFVLKESIESSRSRSAVWRFRVLSWPHEIPTTARVTAASARIFGRAEAESKVTIRQVAQGSASVAGGSEDDGAMVIMSVRATEHSLLVLTVQFDDGRTTLEAVLAAHMLRTGLRAVPFKHFTATPHNCNVLCVVELADSVE